MFVCIEIMTIFDAEKTSWQNARHVLGHIFYTNRNTNHKTRRYEKIFTFHRSLRFGIDRKRTGERITTAREI